MTEQANSAADHSTLPPVRGNSQIWIVAALMAVILASGAAIGAGGVLLWAGKRRPRPPKPVDRAAIAIAEKVARTCHLDERQTEQVRQAVGERLAAIAKIRQEMAEEVLAEHELLKEQLREVLTEEQFEKWLQRMEEARERTWLFGRGRHGDRRGQTDRDGRGRQKRPRRRPRGAQGMLRRFDADGDGMLTRQEIPPWLWPRLSEADTDGDGTIDRDEMRDLPPDRPRRPQP